MPVCIARSSAAVVHRVPPSSVKEFKEWQRGITATAEEFPGYEGTDLYPPNDPQSEEWITVIHFEDDDSLQNWIDSPERAEWVEKLGGAIGEFEMKRLTGGFSAWFSGARKTPKEATPGWKMALTVLFGLYPTVMLLSIFVSPFTNPWGFAFSMLIGNALSVSILQWIVMPALVRVLMPWLEANGRAKRALSIVGAVALVGLLVALSFAFRPLMG
jgi:antibiotic biosynthesis monooxygenase (ABM) superfamily enzyme